MQVDALPGRLGDPTRTLETDDRADPRLVEAFAAAGGFAPGVDPIRDGATYDECLAYCASFEQAASVLHPLQLSSLPAFDTVTTRTQTITGVDGNEITLYIHRPNVEGPLPGIVHTHGGGMVLMTAQDPNFIRWRNSLAARGMVVVGVEFRNGGGTLGNYPFPAGLNDCASATQWVHANKLELGISSIVISGESGGGNLALATTLKARREGWLNQIDGVFAMCPYISGCYANPDERLLSLSENDGYLLDCRQMGALVTVYDPTGEHATNPLAWPYHASPEDLAGLPPHVISVNELDPLRDEGLAYYRKLLRARVPVVARTVHGTPHAGDMSFPDVTPEVFEDTLRALHGFALSLN